MRELDELRSRTGRGRARGIWVVEPLFMLDLLQQRVADDDDEAPAREETYFAGGRLHDADLREAATEDREQRARPRASAAPRPRPATSGSGTTSAPASPG